MVPTPRRPRSTGSRVSALANSDMHIIKGPVFPTNALFARPPVPDQPPASPTKIVPHINTFQAVQIQQVTTENTSLRKQVKSLSTQIKMLERQLRDAQAHIAKGARRNTGEGGSSGRGGRKALEGMMEDNGMVNPPAKGLIPLATAKSAKPMTRLVPPTPRKKRLSSASASARRSDGRTLRP